MKQFTNTYNPQIELWFDVKDFAYGNIQDAFVNNKLFADVATLVKKMCPSVPLTFNGSTWGHRNGPAFYVQYIVRQNNFGFAVQVSRFEDKDEIRYELRLKEYNCKKGEVDVYLPTRLQKMVGGKMHLRSYIDDSNKRVVLRNCDPEFILKIIDAMVTPHRRESIEKMITETAKQAAQEEMYHNLIDCELLEVMPEIRKIMHDKRCVTIEDPRDSGANKATTLFEGKYGRRFEIFFTPTYMYLHYCCGNSTDMSDVDHTTLGLIRSALRINKIEFDRYIKYEDKAIMFELITRMCNMYNQCIHAVYEPWGTASAGLKRTKGEE